MRVLAHPVAVLGSIAVMFGIAGCTSNPSPIPPLNWQKVAGPETGGAVLGNGAAGSFDEITNFTVTAFRDGDKIRLYYGGSASDAGTGPSGGCSGINSTHWRIGLAESSDGVTFTRVPVLPNGAILDNGAAGEFDSQLTYRPFVLKDDTVYRMWYNGSSHPFNCPTGTPALDRRIGYAESSDGVAWTKHNEGGPDAILPLGPPGSIDELQIGYVCVLKDGAQYKMYYSANDATDTWRVALAVSTDARTWTKVPGNLPRGAVLDIGAPGSFDVDCAYQPSVVKERDHLYRMWYRGCATRSAFGGPSQGTIGYAESSDGITWVKVPQPTPAGDALEIGTGSAFDVGGLTSPSVFLDGKTWNMYYAGINGSALYHTGLARAVKQ